MRKSAVDHTYCTGVVQAGGITVPIQIAACIAIECCKMYDI